MGPSALLLSQQQNISTDFSSVDWVIATEFPGSWDEEAASVTWIRDSQSRQSSQLGHFGTVPWRQRWECWTNRDSDAPGGNEPSETLFCSPLINAHRKPRSPHRCHSGRGAHRDRVAVYSAGPRHLSAATTPKSHNKGFTMFISFVFSSSPAAAPAFRNSGSCAYAVKSLGSRGAIILLNDGQRVSRQFH